MSEDNPIVVPDSTASSRSSSPAPSEVSSVEAALRHAERMDPGPGEFVARPPALGTIQELIDVWRGDTNPRPTSEEVRTFIRAVGGVFHQDWWFNQEAARTLDEVSLLSIA